MRLWDALKVGLHIVLFYNKEDALSSLYLYSISQGTCVHVFTAHENWVRCVLLHPSGKFIISASDDKSIRVFDIKVRI